MEIMMMKMMMANSKKEESKAPGLVDFVFSWSISDVMNKCYYSDKVRQIPETFTSTNHYKKSFIYPLLEETRADLSSNLTTLSRAPFSEVLDVEVSKDFKPPKQLCYVLSLKPTSENDRKERIYEPEFGDLIALTDLKPKCIDDLNRPKTPYLLALVQGFDEEYPFELPILSSKPIEFEKQDEVKGKTGDKLYAVYLTNLNTNMRIWRALHTDQEVTNMKILGSVMRVDPTVGSTCSICDSEKAKGDPRLNQIAGIHNSGLDKSQESAVLSCISTKDCNHHNTVKLIWGPPGTGKTKTVASLLFVLLQMKCRTLTCAPTNVAVLGVINRLMSLVRPTLKNDNYGLGDIVLFGNKKRLKIDDYEELFDVFMDHRVSELSNCLAPLTGWRGSTDSMIRLLEDPMEQYQLYLCKEEGNDENDDDENVSDEGVEREETFLNGIQGKLDEGENRGLKGIKQNNWKNVIVQTLKETKKKKTRDNKAASRELKHSKKKKTRDNKAASKELKHSKKKKTRDNKAASKELKHGKEGKKSKRQQENLLTFEEFFMKTFTSIGNRLIFCITSLCTHMPTSVIQTELAKDLISVMDLLQDIRNLVSNVVVLGEGLREALYGTGTADGRKRHWNELLVTRSECLIKLKSVLEKICLPNIVQKSEIRRFCLQNGSLIFCTASSSSKLHTELTQPLELLIIDEAAQLKECESAIPLQLRGIRHAILIGDQKQLPAMVQSEMSEKAEFGRSLFERLAGLGHPKHLLNVQYRMHPSISWFPNREFYENQITDGANVRDASYKKCFLDGVIYGPYSFIDITHGKEQFDDRHSRKSLVEVYVVAEIIAKLYKQFLASKQKVRVGCISPYKAQVFAIQEKLGKSYSTDIGSDFSVNVRSVDGFQGGEEDIIIISTVRCNGNGSIGFLSNQQRTNVALTRARHCLWILGNSATLLNSGSVWKKLVLDAGARGCFYNATADQDLVQAVSSALIEGGQFDMLLDNRSILYKTTRWKVDFSKEFSKSLARIRDSEIHKEVVSLLKRLSNGWRQPPNGNKRAIENCAAVSSSMLELYDVKGPLKLAWSIDIQRHDSKDIQVIKVWDILPDSRVPDLARSLDELFGNYTLNTINRCKLSKLEGNLAVSVSWPLGSNAVSRTNAIGDDPTESLAGRLATMNLRDEQRPFARNFRNDSNRRKYRKYDRK